MRGVSNLPGPGVLVVLAMSLVCTSCEAPRSPRIVLGAIMLGDEAVMVEVVGEAYAARRRDASGRVMWTTPLGDPTNRKDPLFMTHDDDQIVINLSGRYVALSLADGHMRWTADSPWEHSPEHGLVRVGHLLTSREDEQLSSIDRVTGEVFRGRGLSEALRWPFAIYGDRLVTKVYGGLEVWQATPSGLSLVHGPIELDPWCATPTTLVVGGHTPESTARADALRAVLGVDVHSRGTWLVTGCAQHGAALVVSGTIPVETMERVLYHFGDETKSLADHWFGMPHVVPGAAVRFALGPSVGFTGQTTLPRFVPAWRGHRRERLVVLDLAKLKETWSAAPANHAEGLTPSDVALLGETWVVMAFGSLFTIDGRTGEVVSSLTLDRLLTLAIPTGAATQRLWIVRGKRSTLLELPSLKPIGGDVRGLTPGRAWLQLAAD